MGACEGKVLGACESYAVTDSRHANSQGLDHRCVRHCECSDFWLTLVIKQGRILVLRAYDAQVFEPYPCDKCLNVPDLQPSEVFERLGPVDFARLLRLSQVVLTQAVTFNHLALLWCTDHHATH